MKRIIFGIICISFLTTLIVKGQPTDAANKALADQIRNETAPGGNTRQRVADAFQSLNDGKVAIISGVNATGLNTYSATVGSTVTSYVNGQHFYVKIPTANSGASTLNLGPGAKAISIDGIGTPVPSGALKANRWYDLVYDASVGNFQTIGELVSAGSGTVTSVGLSLPSIFSVTGSPVTSSGTLSATLATQSANTILAGPSTGVAAAPTFRTLGASDIPSLPYWLDGGITNLTNDASIDGQSNTYGVQFTNLLELTASVSGGNIDLATDNDFLISSGNFFMGAGGLGNMIQGTNSGLELSSAGSAVLVIEPSAMTINPGTSGGGSTANGDTYYHNTNLKRLPIGSAGQFYKVSGGLLPSWASIVAGDIPTLNQNTTGSAATLAVTRTIGIITGDATSAGSGFNGSANNTNALTLATVNSNVGSFGTATQVPQITVNAKGLITAASNVTITPAISSVTGLGTNVATWLATPSWTNFTAAITGTAPFWNITGATAISAPVITGIPTFTGNANESIFNGSWTASANNQRHLYLNPTITMRSNTNDMASGIYVAPVLNPGGTTQDAVGMVVSPILNLKGGLATITSIQTNTTAGCTNGTTTSFSGYTYTNMDGTGATGSGALFTVIVTANAISSVTMTTAGSGYRPGDRFVFNGSSFGGSGAATLYAVTLDRALNSSAAALRIVSNNYYSTNNAVSPVNKWIDFQANIAGTPTSLMYIGHYINGGSSTTVAMGDSFGELFNANAGVVNMTRALTANAAFISAISTTTKEITYNGTNTQSSSNLSALQSSVTQRFAVANQRFGAVYTANTVGTGVPATGSISNAGSGYTNGTFAGTAMTGGSGTGLLASITVAGGVVTLVTIIANSAINYRVGDVLSASLAGGSGFQYTLATVDFNGTINSTVRNSNTYTDNAGAATMKNLVVYDDRTVTQNSTAGTPYIATLEQNITVSSGTPNLYGILIRNSTSYSSFGLGSTNPGALIDVGASTTTRAPLRLRAGTAPTSPNDGDIWFDGTDIKMRVGGVTKTFTLL